MKSYQAVNETKIETTVVGNGITLSKDNLKLSFIMILFFWLLIPVYKYSVDRFGYLGYYGTFSVDFGRVVIASFLALFFTWYAFKIKNKFLRLTYVASLMLLYYGELCSFICTENFNCTMIIIISVFLLMFRFIDCLRFKTSNEKQAKHKVNDKVLLLLLVVCVLLFLPFLSYAPNINIRNLLLLDIYDTRTEFAGLGGRIAGYIKEPLARVLLPMLLILSLKNKKKSYVILSSLMILYIFLCGGLKSILFGFACIIFFYVGSYEQKIKNFVYMIFLGEVIGIIFFGIFKFDTIISLYRRLFILPPRLNQFYVEFFKNDLTFYRHSGFSWVDDPRFYGMDISHFAGKYILGTGTNANTGIFVEGYYSFGLVGALLYLAVPLSIIAYLKSLNFNNKYYGIFFVYIYYFNTSIFSTLLLTHGLLLFLIVFTVFLRNTETGKSKVNSVKK